MDIYVIQPGDTIASIAEQFGVTSNQIILDNGLINPQNLVPGQTLVITYPSQTHTVQEGDTLTSIAADYGISVMQLYRNNSFLIDRQYIYPGETLVISYPTEREIITIGYSYSYIREDILRRTLPYLTYLSVFNYRATAEGEIVSFSDDTQVIRIAKEYGTVPIAMMTTLTAEGTNDLNVAYRLLVDEDYQDRQLENFIRLMREKGYQGANFIFYTLNTSNQELYIKFLEKLSARME